MMQSLVPGGVVGIKIYRVKMGEFTKSNGIQKEKSCHEDTPGGFRVGDESFSCLRGAVAGAGWQGGQCL